ncbi:MAG: protein kinase [Acidobacteriota bacterium]|nr:MAG: protein kinase [Acidobacteriota bacterium]
MPPIPFVVGQWVRGEKFYGRSELIEEILDGPRNSLWLLGTRRIGKTSLLKQLEHLTNASEKRVYLPLFWDLQGAVTERELHLSFGDALLDAEDGLSEAELSIADVEAADLFASLGRLRRKLRSRKMRLLLLCDEVEELIGLHRMEPALLRKLRRALQSSDDIRSVLASSIRLWELADQRVDTSPFLHGFTPPLYIRNLTDDEARALIRQTQSHNRLTTPFDEQIVETIQSRCDSHPYLLQLLCKRYLELQDIDEAVEHVATDRMVSYFFSVDFEMLSGVERNIVRIIRERAASDSASIQRHLALDSAAITGHLHRLESLGYIRRDHDRRFVLANYFFRRWLEQLPEVQELSEVAETAGPARSPADASAATATRQDLGVISGRYDLLELIGAGAMGVVYRAHDRLLNTTVAVKILKQEFAAQSEALERFRQEILLSRDIGHPNILRAYDVGESQGQMFLTMPWVDGRTLANKLSTEGALPAETVLSIGTKIAAAMEAAHARDILHRDVKPQNILLDREDEPYLSDFGLARLLGQPGLTQGHVFLGTPFYASPEQAQLDVVDERSDIYALGVVMFEMATGRKPFGGETSAEVLEKHRSSMPPNPRKLNPRVSRELTAVILRCLEKDPKERFASAREVREALERIHAKPSGEA